MKNFTLTSVLVLLTSFLFHAPLHSQNVFYEGLESGFSNGGCINSNGWTYATVTGGNCWCGNNTNSLYPSNPASPVTGTWNAYLKTYTLSGGNSTWLFKSVSLTGGQLYRLSLFARQTQASSQYASLTLKYGTTNTAAGMTGAIMNSTTLINSEYQLLKGTFTPASTGTYYIGILGAVLTPAQGTYNYILIDDISLDMVTTPLAGTKTIKTSGGNYSTLTAAVLDLNANGVGSGGVTFNMDAGMTLTENCPRISASGTSGNPILFQRSGTGANPVYKPTGGVGLTDAGFCIYGGDYITVDGLDITIASGSALEYGYYIINASAVNGAQYNTIKNTKITLNRTNTASIGIYQNNAFTPTDQPTGNNNYNNFYNITIENVYTGIYLQGYSSTYFDLGCTIGTMAGGSTTIGSSSANDIGNGGASVYGIRAGYQKNVTVSNSTIRNLKCTYIAATSAGIFLENSLGTSVVSNNRIGPLTNSSLLSTLNGLIAGMRLDVASGESANIYNNSIFGITTGQTSATASDASSVMQATGIFTGTTGGTSNLYYNSIRIESSAYINSSCITCTGGTSLLKDNILTNFTATQTGTPAHYCMMMQGGSISTTDYNDFYIANTSNGYVGYYSGSNKQTLNDWKTATGQDANSGNSQINFVSTTDLHLTLNSACDATLNGTPINGITTDQDGVTRNVTTPAMGAYERTCIPVPSTQASNIVFASTTNNQTGISWSSGDGTSRVVFIAAASTGAPSPVNGTTYTANTTYGSGTQIGSSGWYCIYNNTGTSVTVTGLSAATTYRVMVQEYNGSAGGQMYLTSTATNNPNNVTTAGVPTISSFSPTSAGTGTSVVITGTYLTGATAVSFGGTAASSYTVNSATQITAVVGSGTSGSVSVTTPGGTATKTGFTFISQTTWTGATNNDWSTASNWSSNAVPDAYCNVVIPLVINLPVVNEAPATSAICNNLTIDPMAFLSINPGKALTVSGTLTNNEGITGLSIESDEANGSGSLIHHTADVMGHFSSTISGSNSLTNYKYHLVSIPLAPSNVSLSSIFTDEYLYDFDVTNNAWNNLGNSTTTELDETKGYMVYNPVAGYITNFFEGNLNAGEFTPTVIYGGSGFNLVPNPYPSAIDWNAAQGWTKTNISGSTWIWSAANGNYATYNTVSGGTNNGTKYVPAGQAFFVEATAAAPALVMNDNVRCHSTQPFWKSALNLPDRLSIKAESNGYSDEAVVRFDNEATLENDLSMDTPKMMGLDNAPQLYTVANDNTELSINSLPHSAGAVTVPLNFELKADKSATFTVSGVENFSPSSTIYLEDKLNNTTINLKQQSTYTFNHQQGNDAGRFLLHFNGVTGVRPQASGLRQLWIYDGKVYFNAPELSGQQATLEVFNMLGQILQSSVLSLQSAGLTTVELSCHGLVIVRLSSGEKVVTCRGLVN